MSDSYEAVALVSDASLELEGAEMQHCVANFVDACMDGDSRIFSIRKDGVPIATLELRKARKYWLVQQCYGKRNSAVSDDVLAIAELVCAAYIKAENKSMRKAA